MRTASVVTLLVLLGGCGGSRVWQREGIGPVATTLDLEGCTLWATDRVEIETGVRVPGRDLAPDEGLDEYFEEERLRRDAYVARCMRSAGYELVSR